VFALLLALLLFFAWVGVLLFDGVNGHSTGHAVMRHSLQPSTLRRPCAPSPPIALGADRRWAHVRAQHRSMSLPALRQQRPRPAPRAGPDLHFDTYGNAVYALCMLLTSCNFPDVALPAYRRSSSCYVSRRIAASCGLS